MSNAVKLTRRERVALYVFDNFPDSAIADIDRIIRGSNNGRAPVSMDFARQHSMTSSQLSSFNERFPETQKVRIG